MRRQSMKPVKSSLKVQKNRFTPPANGRVPNRRPGSRLPEPFPRGAVVIRKGV